MIHGCVGLLLPLLAGAWSTDFDNALRTANAEKKRVLVYVLDSV